MYGIVQYYLFQDMRDIRDLFAGKAVCVLSWPGKKNMAELISRSTTLGLYEFFPNRLT